MQQFAGSALGFKRAGNEQRRADRMACNRGVNQTWRWFSAAAP